MQKRVGQKNNQTKTFTYDEYLNNFFPKLLKSNVHKIDEPSEMGISLARASLSKMQNILTHSSR